MIQYTRSFGTSSDKIFKTKVEDKDVLKFIRLGEEPYPQIPPNGKWLSPKFQKSEIGNFRKQNEFSPKIKFGGYG